MKRLITGSIFVRLSKSRFNAFSTCLRVVFLCPFAFRGEIVSLFSLFFFRRDKINRDNVLIIKLIELDYLSSVRIK